ncbi:MAG: TolC family protein [Ignavibacterium sp.]|uniref:TolC family protein n=1 Tax=Ignavibacterium sp. TaxID=2651167 RepID=UPI0032974821
MKKVFVLLMLAISTIHSQSLTLEDAIDYALKHNVQIKQYEAKLTQKEYQNLEALGNFLPQINLNASYTHLNDPIVIDLDPIRQAMIQLQSKNQVEFANIYNLLQGNPQLTNEQRNFLFNQYSTQLNSLIPPFTKELKKQDYKTATLVGIQPIFTGGKLLAAKRFTSLDEKAAEVELKQIKDEVTKEVTKKYLAVVLMNDVIKIRSDVVESVKKHRDRADKMLKQGLISNHNLLRAEVALADAEKNLFEDKNKLELAYLALKNEMGMDLNETIVIDDSIIFRDFADSLDYLLNLAKNNNSILQLIELKKQQAEQKYNVERSSFLPTLAAFGKYELYPEYLSTLEPRWAVGLSLNINLFNGMRDYAKLQVADYLIEEVNALQKNVENKISLLINKSFKDVMNAREKYFRNKTTVALAVENLRLNEKRFETGLGTSLEVVDANLAFEKALLDSESSLFEYYSNLTQLYSVAGNPMNVLTILKNKEN